MATDQPHAVSRLRYVTTNIVGRSAMLIAAAALAATGCRTSQQASIPNPFLTADRVPAAPSRIPPVGTAQPYYPGDAMPPLPGAAAPLPATQPLGALPPSNDITPIPADDSFATAAPNAAPLPLTSSIGGDEPTVQIPGDEQALRFAAVPSSSPTVDLPAATPVTTQQPTPTAFRQQHPPSQTTPVVSNWPPVPLPAKQVTLSPVSNGSASVGLFRKPGVGSQAPPLFQESVPAEGQTTVPRIRVPGAIDRIREDVVPGNINTTSYQVGFAGGSPVQTMIVPPTGQPPAPLSSGAIAAPVSGDGFRPRSSARNAFGSGQAPATPTLHVTPG